MPFGLTGAPSFFQRTMNQLICCFEDYHFVNIYIDNILIHLANKSQHALHLRQVFELLNEANLTLRGSRCHLAKSEVAYVFFATGMSPDHYKVVAVAAPF